VSRSARTSRTFHHTGVVMEKFCAEMIPARTEAVKRAVKYILAVVPSIMTGGESSERSVLD